MIVDVEVQESLRRHWEDGWNGRDLEVIMAPYAADVVFSSPAIPKYTGDPQQATIEGHDALRDYCAAALQRSGDVRYRVDSVFSGAETVVLLYTCMFPDGREQPGTDLMRLDGDGKVVEWRCHYFSDPTAWRPDV